MDIFSDSLTTEETNSQFALNEVDNESFAIQQLGGAYPGTVPTMAEDTILNSMNERRDELNVEAGYETGSEIPSNDAELDDNTVAKDLIQEEPVSNPEQIEDIADFSAIPAQPSAIAEEPADITEEGKDIVDINDVAIVDEDILTNETPADSAILGTEPIASADTPPVAETPTEPADFSDNAAINEEAKAEQNVFSGLADIEQISSIDDVFNITNEITTESAASNATSQEEAISGNVSIAEAEIVNDATNVPPAGASTEMQIDDELRSLLMDDLQEEGVPVANEQAPIATEEAPPNTESQEEVATEEPVVATPIIDITDNNEDTKPASNDAEQEVDEVEWDSETDQIKTSLKLNKKQVNADKKNKTFKRKEEKEEEMTEEEEKNSTKKFALILVIVAIVMILIIGGIIGYLYLSSKSNISTDKASDTQQVDSTKSLDSSSTVSADSTATHTSDSTAKADSSAIDTNKILEDTLSKIQQQTPVPVPPANNTPVSQPVKPKTVAPTNAQTPKRQAVPKANVTKPKANKTQKTTTTKAVTTNSEHLYSIQMYSSPSKSDAEERLVLLARKNISGYITTQQIKGQTWYRVRFGRYQTYEEAMAEVQRLDLKDAWIERIK